jgi:hypothetical protein
VETRTVIERTILEVVTGLTDQLGTLDKALRKARGLPDMPAAEGLVELARIDGRVKKVSRALLAAIEKNASNGDGGK